MTNVTKVEVRGYTGAGAGSGFIKWFTFGDYSHVSIVFYLAHGPVIEVEALQGKGVINHEPVDFGDFDTLIVPLMPEQAWKAYQTALSLVGSDYDWRGIYGFLRRKKKHSADKWFCSELVAYCLYKAGYPLSRRDPYRETPSTVMDSLRLK